MSYMSTQMELSTLTPALLELLELDAIIATTRVAIAKDYYNTQLKEKITNLKDKKTKLIATGYSGLFRDYSALKKNY